LNGQRSTAIRFCLIAFYNYGPLASASSAASVAGLRCMAYEITGPGLQYRDLASVAAMLLTVLAMLTKARAFGSFCCRCVLRGETRYRCLRRARMFGLGAGGRRVPAGCGANRGGGLTLVGAAVCRRRARSRRLFQPTDPGSPSGLARRSQPDQPRSRFRGWLGDWPDRRAQ
jgi:hypothetical protein